MINLRARLTERIEDLQEYLTFLENLETQVRNGVPRIGGEDGIAISSKQIQALYSSFYMQIYNTVEATVVQCIESLCEAIKSDEISPSDLTPNLQKEWVKNKAKCNDSMNANNRLKQTMKLFEDLTAQIPIAQFSIEKGGGGNWDDNEIEKFISRLGWQLNLERELMTRVKRKVKNDLGPIGYIKSLRNKLAHGAISFVECGEGVTTSDLKAIFTTSSDYLNQVVTLFDDIIQQKSFISQTS